MPFRKTHDLTELGEQCADVDVSLLQALKAASDLSDYAVEFRYVDAPHEPDEPEALAALATASHLFNEIRARLPAPGPHPARDSD